ncbi:DnaJ heat shock protein family (Hsp40) member C28 L homeolog [Xenopus laevis]|uniref:DnaJ heat shock protein family (Hsp40) member C28 L homeolog n=1 Tax=Xenopus laevis TaxID=8355 RepID=Q4KLD1_XENLA|nr:DnaJ heat shock protein family (Hsp40) member C28 L homeolog [Xenopus laevis]AAH99284.1 MGC116476 protein [Xenopus laevis]
MKLLGIVQLRNSKCSFYTSVIPRIMSWHWILFFRSHSTIKYKRTVKDCCRILNVPEGCSVEEVRHSYRCLAKKYHPDSGSLCADAGKFMEVDEAYKALLTHLAKEIKKGESEANEETTTESKVPQHRHYLSFEGVGYGTPSQREKQYTQFRVDRATDQVLEFRKQKLERQYSENSMVAKDVRQSKKIKITQAIERLVEDLIQESMAKGDFDNLSGKGKPLNKFSYCPHIDPMTHNLNRILIDNGYQPEWILLQKEIRETIETLRNEVLASRVKLGDPLTPKTSKKWEETCDQFKEDITKLNKRINDFNLVVPLLNRQMVHFNAAKVISQAEKMYAAQRETMRKADEIKAERMELKEQQLEPKKNLLNWIKQLKTF